VPVNRTSRGRRETYVLTLRPMPGVNGVRALRFALRCLKRRYGLQAMKVEPLATPVPTDAVADRRASVAPPY
jgi:hypothetical protein